MRANAHTRWRLKLSKDCPQANAATNADARRAIDLLVYRITREIGSLIAALGGLDGVVFTAGIGENDVATRAEVMAGLGWTSITLDKAANRTSGPRFCSDAAAQIRGAALPVDGGWTAQ